MVDEERYCNKQQQQHDEHRCSTVYHFPEGAAKLAPSLAG